MGSIPRELRSGCVRSTLGYEFIIMKIAAVILAAGKSERMGIPKPLLPIGGSTFLNTIIESLKKAGLEEIITVLGHNAGEIRSQLPAGVKSVMNKNYERGQLSSLKVGLRVLPPDEGAFLMVLVDHPLVSEATYKTITKHLARGAPIVLPTYRGKRGHPVGFNSKYIKELMEAPEDIGARFVIRNNIDNLMELPVDDKNVICNINTKEEYERYKKSILKH